MTVIPAGGLQKKLVLLLGPLGLVGCKTTESYPVGVPDPVWPAHSFLIDRVAVQDPLRQQAVNGAVAHATMYNYYFDVQSTELAIGKDGIPTGQVRTLPIPRPTAQLSPWGKEVLNRLARQATGQQLCVYVQTGEDIATSTSAPAAAAKARAELNTKRVQAVQAYLAAMRPDLVATVEVNDPFPVGMSGKESRGGYDKMLSAPTGNLSQSAIIGTDIGAGLSTLQGGASQGPGPGQTPPPTPQAPPAPPTAAPGGLAPGAAPAAGPAPPPPADPAAVPPPM